jgi:hypothetical protein
VKHVAVQGFALERTPRQAVVEERAQSALRDARRRKVE